MSEPIEVRGRVCGYSELPDGETALLTVRVVLSDARELLRVGAVPAMVTVRYPQNRPDEGGA